MQIDWVAVAIIAEPIIALVVGAAANRWVENRPILISYWGHAEATRVRQGGQEFTVHTHAVILRNAGRRSATNVRLHHATLPDFSIWPNVMHHIEDVPGGGKDIVVPTLVPNEQITISYIYVPPLVYTGVNAGIKSEEGFAKQVPVLLQRQYPQWWNVAATVVFLFGLVTLFYLAYLVARLIWRTM